MLAGLAFLLTMAAQTQPAVLADKPQLICREGEEHTGSRIRTGRRCKTAEEWQIEDQRRDAQPTSMRVTDNQRDALPTPKRPQ